MRSELLVILVCLTLTMFFPTGVQASEREKGLRERFITVEPTPRVKRIRQRQLGQLEPLATPAWFGIDEATMQHEFVTAFLEKCKQHYIHTAIETCGYVKWEHFQELLGHLDLVHMDIKHMDPVEHKRLTRVPNEIILENVRRAAAVRSTIIRTPVVPGLNDSDDNILATARFVAGLGENVKRYELLPYHQFGVPKYGQLEIEYKLAHVEPPSDDHMNHLKRLVESCGVKAQIGG